MKFTASVASIALAAVVGFGAPASDARAEEINVGLMLPFSGVYASLGSHIQNGFNLGVEHYGDRLGAHTLNVISADTEADPAGSLAKARQLVFQDQADVLVGIVSSAVLGALRDFVDQSEIPLIVANAGNDHATGKDCSAYIVRVSFANGQVNAPMGTWMAEQGIETAYLMAPDYAAGHQMMTAFRETFEAAGGRIIGEAYPPLEGVDDYGPYLAGVQASGADALFTFFAGGAAIAFVKQYHEFGMAEEIPLFGSGFLTSAAYKHVQAEAADGVTVSLHYTPSIDTPENKRFQEAYAAAYEGRLGSEFAVAGYDAARLLIEAIAATDGDTDALAAALPQVSFTGPRGPLTIDPATNNVVQNVYVFRNEWRDGQVQQTILDTIENVRMPADECSM